MQVVIKPSDVYYQVTKEQIAKYLAETKQKIVGFRLVKPKDKILGVTKMYGTYPEKYQVVAIEVGPGTTYGHFRYILEPNDPCAESVPGWE